MVEINSLVSNQPRFNHCLNRSFELRYLNATSFSHSKFVCLSELNSKIGLSKVGLVKKTGLSSKEKKTSLRMSGHEAFVKDSVEFPSVSAVDKFEATLNSQTKWLVNIYFLAVLLWRNDAESLWAATGSVINFVICLTLKKTLNQRRPITTMKYDPGMPSAHAQCIFYISLISIFSIIEKLGVNEFTMMITTISLACGSYLSWLRVSQQFHTRSQVVIGATIGCTFSIIWSWLWHAIVYEAFVSYYWVRTSVILGAATFFLGFISYVVRHSITHQ
ncbi:lipid phosphate phosphatase epsilon 2, chloroplastic-like [Mercurialis annua]|uniref:lipid phosphate phosphatase epsilon 2, chloroplastic-like n=1 Tax=Mercurialis annua TaxID=3986 RepID=UPI00215FBBE2|nr:lipid phosphate phosphatase epsilon 2, chloroplastic-like [Mercurialis annua]